MGSGKSTIGPILANTIGYDFVDIDRAVEAAVGKSVNDIFLDSGEDHFRALEAAIIGEVSVRSALVISLGGGTIMEEENRRIITASGITVYLKSTPENIYKRVHHRDDRPVLKDTTGHRLSDEQLWRRIQDLYNLREPVYAGADFTIVTDDRRVGLTVDDIVRKLTPVLR